MHTTHTTPTRAAFATMVVKKLWMSTKIKFAKSMQKDYVDDQRSMPRRSDFDPHANHMGEAHFKIGSFKFQPTHEFNEININFEKR